MSTETELKYSAVPGIFTDRILCSDMISSGVIENSHSVIDMKAVYYDDAAKTLAGNGIGFRIRKENSQIIATVKYTDESGHTGRSYHESAEGLSRRSEYNLPADNENADPTMFAGIIPNRRVTDILCGLSLIPQFTTEFKRELVHVKYKKSVIELSYDCGLIYSTSASRDSEDVRSSLSISEIECELKSGNEADLLEFGDVLASEFDLSPLNDSKLKRGLSLLTE